MALTDLCPLGCGPDNNPHGFHGLPCEERTPLPGWGSVATGRCGCDGPWAEERTEA